LTRINLAQANRSSKPVTVCFTVNKLSVSDLTHISHQ